MTTDRERLAATFDRSADLYDEVRPGYPDALFDDIERLAGLPTGARVLEIGAGTGKATVAFARRGHRVTALEPGPSLAAVLRRNVAGFSNANVVETSFEAWPAEVDAFDLVAAATSFPWVDPALRYTKTAEALRPGACLAIFWHYHVAIPGEDTFFDVSQDLHNQYGYPRELVGSPPEAAVVPTGIPPEALDSGLFEAVAVRHYPWSERITSDRYIKLLRTFSGYLDLPEERREPLLAGLGALIDNDFGGAITERYVTVLQLLRRV